MNIYVYHIYTKSLIIRTDYNVTGMIKFGTDAQFHLQNNGNTHLYNFWVYVAQFINFMHKFVDINAIVFCGHLVITVPARIQ